VRFEAEVLPFISQKIIQGTPAPPPNNRAGNMLSEVLKNESLFWALYKIDLATAEQYRQMRCPHCQGPLYYANYPRKPRGEPDGLSEEYFLRFSLCCGKEGCRRRLIPPSCRFLGRKVYWYAAILTIMSDWQNKIQNITISEFAREMAISRNTLKRWIHFFKNIFPVSVQWKKIRGRVSGIVKNDRLPGKLIDYYLQQQPNIERIRPMNSKTQSPVNKWALFRFSVVGGLLANPPAKGELRKELERLSHQIYTHPITSKSTIFHFSTIECWYYKAKNAQDPIIALGRKICSDYGSSIVLTPELIRMLGQQYRTYPGWSYKLHADNLGAEIQEKDDSVPIPSYASVRRRMVERGWNKKTSPKKNPTASKFGWIIEKRGLRGVMWRPAFCCSGNPYLHFIRSD